MQVKVTYKDGTTGTEIDDSKRSKIKEVSLFNGTEQLSLVMCGDGRKPIIREGDTFIIGWNNGPDDSVLNYYKDGELLETKYDLDGFELTEYEVV